MASTSDNKDFKTSIMEAFKVFSKFGDSKNDGSYITLSNADKWMKQAGVIDGKKITTTDTGICFGKFKSKTLTYAQFEEYVRTLAKDKHVAAEDLLKKLGICQTPGSSGTNAPKSSTVDRLTDTSKYTGAHKERFDESGKGKGKEGRDNIDKNEGYVSGYKNKDTYNGTH